METSPQTCNEPYSNKVPHTAAVATSEKDPINSLIPFPNSWAGSEGGNGIYHHATYFRQLVQLIM